MDPTYRTKETTTKEQRRWAQGHKAGDDKQFSRGSRLHRQQIGPQISSESKKTSPAHECRRSRPCYSQLMMTRERFPEETPTTRNCNTKHWPIRLHKEVTSNDPARVNKKTMRRRRACQRIGLAAGECANTGMMCCARTFASEFIVQRSISLARWVPRTALSASLKTVAR